MNSDAVDICCEIQIKVFIFYMYAHSGHQRVVKTCNSTSLFCGLVMLMRHEYLVNLRDIGILWLVYAIKEIAGLYKKPCCSRIHIR